MVSTLLSFLMRHVPWHLHSSFSPLSSSLNPEAQTVVFSQAELVYLLLQVGEFAIIVPLLHQGKTEIVPISKPPQNGIGNNLQNKAQHPSESEFFYVFQKNSTGSFHTNIVATKYTSNKGPSSALSSRTSPLTFPCKAMQRQRASVQRKLLFGG